MYKTFISIGILFLISSCSQKTSIKPEFTYMLEKTDIPMLFFPGTVTQRGKVHFGSAFSNDGKHIVYTTTARGKPGTIVTQTFENQSFSPPIPIENDSIYSYSDASFSPDGNTILLASSRPHLPTQNTKQNSTIWKFNRVGSKWGKPEIVELKMDSIGGFGYPTMTENNTIYFHHSTENANPDIYRAEFKNGKYMKPEKLPYPINTAKHEGDVFVDRKERFIVFAGFDRTDNFGESDLYISFRLDEGWSNPINLGKDINSFGYDGSPYVTVDDQYLIFTSSRHPEKDGEHEYFNLFYVNFNLDLYKSN